MVKFLPTEKYKENEWDEEEKVRLKSWKLGELVKTNHVQGILGRVTSYSSSKGGRCSSFFTMVGRTLGRSRAELTKHENELGEYTFPWCCCWR